MSTRILDVCVCVGGVEVKGRTSTIPSQGVAKISSPLSVLSLFYSLPSCCIVLCVCHPHPCLVHDPSRLVSSSFLLITFQFYNPPDIFFFLWVLSGHLSSVSDCYATQSCIGTYTLNIQLHKHLYYKDHFSLCQTVVFSPQQNKEEQENLLCLECSLHSLRFSYMDSVFYKICTSYYNVFSRNIQYMIEY